MLHLHSQGEGQPVILLHGFCENSTCFNEQVLLLKDQYKVHVMDLPGVGHSPFIENLSIERMADEVHRTMVANNITGALMIGHSMGGYVTLSFAKKYDDMLKGFGLLHSTAKPDTDDRKMKRDQAIQVIQAKGFEFYVRNFIPPLFSEPDQHKELIERLTTEALRTTESNVIAQLLAMKTRPSSIDFLKETDLPVLFVGGIKDQIIPAADVTEQAAMVNKGSMQMLSASAHMGMMEEPRVCADAIRSFAELCFDILP